MKKAVLALFMFLVLIIPVSSFSVDEAASVADKFVVQHGLFSYNYAMVSQFRLFRRVEMADDNNIEFLYMVTKQVGIDVKKGYFSVTVDKITLKVVDLNVIKQESKPKLLF